MIGSVILLIILAVTAYIFTKKSPKNVPGLKKRDKVLGNLADIAEAGSLPAFLKKLHEKYGPIASFWYNETLTVSLAHQKYFRQLEKNFDRHPALFKFAEPLISPKSVQFLNGEFGKSRHKLMSEPFNFVGCSKTFSQVQDIVSTEVNSWKPGQEIGLHEKMMQLAIKIILQSHFGTVETEFVERLSSGYDKVIDDLDDALNGAWNFGDGSKREDDFNRNLQTFKDEIKTIVDAHKERRAVGDYTPAPFLDTVLDEIDDEDELISQAITFMIGGFHTTGTFLTWFFYNNALREDIQDKVIKEVKETKKDGFNSMADIEKLSYTKTVMDETLRFDKVGLFNERQVEKDLHIEGYVIPAGTMVLNAICITLDDKNLFPNPDEFDPTNCQDIKKAGLAFSPFGFGVRKCPGYRFSNMEMAIAAVEVLTKFKLSLVNPDEERIGQVHGFVTKPEREIFVTCKTN